MYESMGDSCELQKLTATLEGIRFGILVSILSMMFGKMCRWCSDSLNHKLKQQVEDLQDENEMLNQQIVGLEGKLYKLRKELDSYMQITDSDYTITTDSE